MQISETSRFSFRRFLRRPFFFEVGSDPDRRKFSGRFHFRTRDQFDGSERNDIGRHPSGIDGEFDRLRRKWRNLVCRNLEKKPRDAFPVYNTASAVVATRIRVSTGAGFVTETDQTTESFAETVEGPERKKPSSPGNPTTMFPGTERQRMAKAKPKNALFICSLR